MSAVIETKPLHVYVAIASVMGALSKVGVAKERKNTQQGYNFRGIDDMYNALAPLLSEAKLLILPRVLSREVVERSTKNGTALFYVVLDVEFDLVSGVDGSKHTVRVVGEAMDSADKATNKAMSAAYKYACMEVFCIPTEGDNDADATTHEVAPTVVTPITKGVKRVNPRGDAEKNADLKKAALYVTELVKVASLSDELGVRQLWDELKEDQDTTIVVWDALRKKHGNAFDFISATLKPTKSTGEGRRS